MFGLRVKVRMLVLMKGYVVSLKIFILNPLTLNQTGFLTNTQKAILIIH